MEIKLNTHGLPMVKTLDQVYEIVRKHFRLKGYTVMVEDFTIDRSDTCCQLQFFKDGELHHAENIRLIADSLTTMEYSLITTLDALERNVLKP